MTNTTAPATYNLIIGNGNVVHALTTLGIPNHPLCGRIRSTAPAQRVRQTQRPVTCKGCLTKAPATETYADKFARVFDL
jgi:hypothetical protein